MVSVADSGETPDRVKQTGAETYSVRGREESRAHAFVNSVWVARRASARWRAAQAPPQECSESGRRHVLCVRRLLVLYSRPRLSPGGQSFGIETRHRRAGSPGREASTEGI